jgi:phenylacetate-CoA ligase
MIVSSIQERLVGSLFFPFSQYLFNRRGIKGGYRRSGRWEFRPAAEIAAAQMRGLRTVVEHASRSVPFYKRLFEDNGIRPEKVVTLEDVRRIPPLSRDDLVRHRRDLLDRRFWSSAKKADASNRGPGEPLPFARLRRHPLVRNTSSGSTGAPVIFYEDGTVSAVSWANEWRVKRWFGLTPGLREARLVRASPDFVFRVRANLLRRRLWNQMLLPGINLSAPDYDLIVDRLERFRPKTIWAFTSAAAGLARHLRNTGNRSPAWKPSLVITWAAPLYDHEREVIRDAFECSISNIYGLREVGHIGATCPAGSLHVFQESHYLETDENGEILVTFLRPSPMPFIRYRTGDLGELAVEKCPCGRTLQVIKELHGRTGEIYHSPDGRMFSPNFWCRVFMDAGLASRVKRFQIVYTRADTIRIKLVVEDQNRRGVEVILRETVSRNFGVERPVAFEYPEDIAPRLSGKYEMVIVEPKEGRP